MKIAQVAPLIESVPPKLYGGTERIVSYLTEELVRQGHEVTLFASGDSRTAAELVAGSETALRLSETRRDPVLEHILMLEKLRARAREFDIIHFHIDLLQFPMLRGLDCPAVTTLHGRMDLPGLASFYQAFPQVHLVTISRSQRRYLAQVTQASLVYHGLPPGLLARASGRGGYLAFLGRVSPEKGPVEAIAIARAAGIPLKLAAKIDAADQDYWRDVVKPLLDHSPGVEYVGEITQREKGEFLGNAKALLFPIDWPEPFGLVMIEAMACGTPVVAYPMGSVPEIVEEGQSGHIVGSRDAALAVLEKIDDLDRRAVRQCFDRRFSVGRMTENYLKLYEQLAEFDRLNGHRHGRPLAVRDVDMPSIRLM